MQPLLNQKIEKKEYYVYTYLDPRKKGKYRYEKVNFLHEPIYIGKGKGNRAFSYYKHNQFVKNKFSKIEKPIILIIANHLTEIEAFNLEKELITLIGRYDLKTGPLCNFTNGGEGGSGRIYITSKETKKKISKSCKGIKRSEEFKQKMRLIQTGQKRLHSEEWKIKQSKSQKGKKRSIESIEKQSLAQKGRIVSEKTKQKISKANKGKKRTKETKEKMSLLRIGKPSNHKGHKVSEETKQKISKNSKKMWENIRRNINGKP